MLDPNLTLPRGFGEPNFERFIAHKLDNHFAPKAALLMTDALAKCRTALECDCHLLAFEYAKAAAHWRRLHDDTRRGFELIEEGEP